MAAEAKFTFITIQALNNPDLEIPIFQSPRTGKHSSDCPVCGKRVTCQLYASVGGAVCDHLNEMHNQAARVDS